MHYWGPPKWTPDAAAGTATRPTARFRAARMGRRVQAASASATSTMRRSSRFRRPLRRGLARPRPRSSCCDTEKAMPHNQWDGPDSRAPLAPRPRAVPFGRRGCRGLRPTSLRLEHPARCLSTIEPTAALLGLPVKTSNSISQDAYAADGEKVRAGRGQAPSRGSMSSVSVQPRPGHPADRPGRRRGGPSASEVGAPRSAAARRASTLRAALSAENDAARPSLASSPPHFTRPPPPGVVRQAASGEFGLVHLPFTGASTLSQRLPTRL